MVNIHPNILEKNGKKEFAIIPYNEFVKMKNELEDYEDLKLLRQAKLKESKSPTTLLDKAKDVLLTNSSRGRSKTRR